MNLYMYSRFKKKYHWTAFTDGPDVIGILQVQVLMWCVQCLVFCFFWQKSKCQQTTDVTRELDWIRYWIPKIKEWNKIDDRKEKSKRKNKLQQQMTTQFNISLKANKQEIGALCSFESVRWITTGYDCTWTIRHLQFALCYIYLQWGLSRINISSLNPLHSALSSLYQLSWLLCRLFVWWKLSSLRFT